MANRDLNYDNFYTIKVRLSFWPDIYRINQERQGSTNYPKTAKVRCATALTPSIIIVLREYRKKQDFD